MLSTKKEKGKNKNYLKNILVNILHEFSHHNLGIITKDFNNNAVNLLTQRYHILEHICWIKLALLTIALTRSSKCLVD